MLWSRPARARTASLDKALVLACWWVVTRSMVVHSVILAVLLTFFADTADVRVITPSYELVLHWAPLWAWGAVLAVAALVWLWTRGIVCIIAGIVVALWFFAFGCAYLAAWIGADVPGTTVTGWATYGFIGWAWLCVTYVCWKDEEHIRDEQAQDRALEEISRKLDDEATSG